MWCWPAASVPDRAALDPLVDKAIRVGRERTFEQDAAFGIRQLVDVACKAMSPAVNDPYTAVQAVDRLSVLFHELAVHPLGTYVAGDPGGAAGVLPGRPVAPYPVPQFGPVPR